MTARQAARLDVGTAAWSAPGAVPASDSPLRAAMTELLTDKRETDDAGLYNSLYRSNLQVDSAEVGDDGTVRVALSGDLVLTGVCEDARIQAQLEETARQFSPSQDVEITINGSPISDVLGGRGPDEGDTTPVLIYMILLDDDGATGRPVGCGDSAVIATRNVVPSGSPPLDSMNALLSDKREYDDDGLYNSLYRSDLVVDNIEIDDQDGTVRVALSGDLVLTGVCEDARIQAQLEETARQHSYSQNVEITVNGTPLAELLSGQG